MHIHRVLVLGAGQMGSGIAQVMVQAGLETHLYDLHDTIVTSAKFKIEKGLDKLLEKGKLTEEQRQNAQQKLHVTTRLDVAREADLAIEAATEKESLKIELFRSLDELMPEKAILASNTSSISITTLAAATRRSPNVIGMHFMNPVPLMKLVEIIRGLQTANDTHDTIQELAILLGKTPVTVHDAPGFVSNRILMPMINEAICVLQEGIATASDIDTVMKLGMNHPMGPLELADFIGLDTCLAIMDVLYDGFNDPKYRPALKLKQMVQAGYLGKKVGQGFYSYPR